MLISLLMLSNLALPTGEVFGLVNISGGYLKGNKVTTLMASRRTKSKISSLRALLGELHLRSEPSLPPSDRTEGAEEIPPLHCCQI